MSKTFSLYVDTAGRSCDGCTKCCEGWLTANIYGYSMSPSEGRCKFLGQGGCGIYPVRATLCKTFQCEWKVNSNIPYNMKPDLSDVILMTRQLDEYYYIRIVYAGKFMPNYVFEWAEAESIKGKHVVGYDKEKNLKVWSKDKKFIDKLKKSYVS